MSTSTIDVVSIEGAQSNLDLSVLSAIGDKTVMLGVLDVGENEVESVESLVSRGQEALRYIPEGAADLGTGLRDAGADAH